MACGVPFSNGHTTRTTCSTPRTGSFSRSRCSELVHADQMLCSVMIICHGCRMQKVQCACRRGGSHRPVHCADYHGSPLPPQDLYKRTQETEGVKKAKLCMHTGTFVFHFKGCVPSPVQCSDRPYHPRSSASEVLSANTKPTAAPLHIPAKMPVLVTTHGVGSSAVRPSRATGGSEPNGTCRLSRRRLRPS